MNSDIPPPADSSELRRQAEKVFRDNETRLPEYLDSFSSEDAQRLFHELRVHQIELEMQNDELRRAQMELDASRERYFELYDLAPVGYCILSNEGLILEINLTGTLLLGLERVALVKQPMSRFIFKDDQDIYHLHRKRLIETDKPQTCELRMIKKDGSLLWARLESAACESSGEQACRVVMCDITKQKQAEASLLELADFNQNVFDSAGTHLAVVGADGYIIAVNEPWRRFGEENKGGGGKVWGVGDNYFVPFSKKWGDTANAKEAFEGIRKVQNRVLPCFSLEYPCHSPDNEKRWFIMHVTPFEKTQGTVLVSHTNITELKLAEEERDRLEALNRQLQKSESLGRMAGAIAHHFNNQLQVVLTALETIQDVLPRDISKKVIEYLADAMRAVLRSSEVSRLMLIYLGQTRTQKELLELPKFCDLCLPMLQAAMPVNVVLETDLPSPGPVVHANANEIQQLLTILFTNAWESAPNLQTKIQVTIKTSIASEISGQYLFPVDFEARDKAYACLEVADTGCGIAPKDMENLFDPFFSSKFTGRGMGLSVVLGIVRAHGGVIMVESKPKEGSVFRVYLPLVSEEIPAPPVRRKNSTENLGGGTVLVVEDEEPVGIMEANMLRGLGFTVLDVQSGSEAVEVFRQHKMIIRFVLCDVSMPGMDGWETLKSLRQIDPGIRVVFASGYDLSHVDSDEYSERPNAFLMKPFTQNQLAHAIRESLAPPKNSENR